MIDFEDVFKEHILPRLIMVLMLTPVALIGWWVFSFFYVTSSQDKWQEQANELPVLTTDSEIAAAINGEPQTYLVKNYCFSGGQTIRDTILDVLDGEYMVIDIRRQRFTITRRSSDTETEMWTDGPFCTLVGQFAFGNGTEIQNADSLKFTFASDKYWQNLKDEYVRPEKLKHVAQDMYYYPEYAMNFDSIGAVLADMPERFKKSVEQTVDQAFKRKKTYDSRFTLCFLRKGEPATFAVRLGGGKADFAALGGNNYMLVACDDMSQRGDTESSFKLAWHITVGIILAAMALAIIMAPKVLDWDK